MLPAFGELAILGKFSGSRAPTTSRGRKLHSTSFEEQPKGTMMSPVWKRNPLLADRGNGYLFSVQVPWRLPQTGEDDLRPKDRKQNTRKTGVEGPYGGLIR